MRTPAEPAKPERRRHFLPSRNNSETAPGAFGEHPYRYGPTNSCDHLRPSSTGVHRVKGVSVLERNRLVLFAVSATLVVGCDSSGDGFAEAGTGVPVARVVAAPAAREGQAEGATPRVRTRNVRSNLPGASSASVIRSIQARAAGTPIARPPSCSIRRPARSSPSPP